jgi:hypothetical protein
LVRPTFWHRVARIPGSTGTGKSLSLNNFGISGVLAARARGTVRERNSAVSFFCVGFGSEKRTYWE